MKFSADLVISEPEITSGKIDDSSEFIIIGSDGLFDVFSNQQAVNFVRHCLMTHGNLSRAAKEIVEKALSKGSHDNISCIIMALNQRGNTLKVKKRKRDGLFESDAGLLCDDANYHDHNC
jgi:protein phosphatase 2C family protein 2/3